MPKVESPESKHLNMARNYESHASVGKPWAGLRSALHFGLDEELRFLGVDFRFTTMFFPDAGENPGENHGIIFLTQRAESVRVSVKDEKRRPFDIYREETLILTDSQAYLVTICPPNTFDNISGKRTFQPVDSILGDFKSESQLERKLKEQNGEVFFSPLAADDVYGVRARIRTHLQRAVETRKQKSFSEPLLDEEQNRSSQVFLVLGQMFNFYAPQLYLGRPLDVNSGETLEQRISEAIVALRKIREPQEPQPEKGSMRGIRRLFESLRVRLPR